MSGLDSRFFQLDAVQKRRVHEALCQQALEIWRTFVAGNAPIVYADSVVGMEHEIENDLPDRALACVLAGGTSSAIAQAYAEPITAMQDDDIAFPNPVEFAYYAIYNLFQKYSQGRATDDWLIVNQALAALPAEAQLAMLRAALDAAE